MPLIRHCEMSCRWTPSSLQRLADGVGPPPLLEDIGWLGEVDDEMAVQLRRLVTLTN